MVNCIFFFFYHFGLVNLYWLSPLILLNSNFFGEIDRGLDMANGWVRSFELQAKTYRAKKWALLNELKTSRVNRIASQVGSSWPIFFILTKIIKNKFQLFRENESNQIVRIFVTNLLLYMRCERKKTEKPTNIKISISLQFK